MERQEYDSWEASGIEVAGKTGQIKTICPQCSHLRKPHNRKEKCLSVNVTDQVFHCGNCEWSGYVRRFPKAGQGGKRYEAPVYRPAPLSEKMADWFLNKRAITRQTLDYFKIFPNTKWIPQVEREVLAIGFPYVEGAQVVNIKSRYDYMEEGVRKKTFALEKGARKILYNVDAVRGQRKAVIVEGEIDALSVHQAGFSAVCSVPNGAPSLKKDPQTGEYLPEHAQPQAHLDYLDDAIEVFAQAEEIVIATDGDLAGRRLRNELARRLGKARCRFVVWPEGYKDFNEILVKHGEQGVLDVLENYTEAFPVEGIVRLEDVMDQVDYIRANGYPKGKDFSHAEFSKHLTLREGEVTTITGIPGHGKSEIVDEMVVEMAERHGWPTAFFAAENGGHAIHSVKLMHRFGRKPVVEDIQRNWWGEKVQNDAEYLRSKVWVNEFVSWIDLKKVGTHLDTILAKARELVAARGIKLLVIDPWNYLEGERESWQSETEFVSTQYSKIVWFAEEMECHVIVVAHPTKMLQNEDGSFKMPTLYHIAGSANFFNKTFNGATVYRDTVNGVTRVAIQKVKFEWIGKTGAVEFGYDEYRRRYYEV